MVIGGYAGSFRVYRGKDTPSPSQLAQKLLRTLPPILIQSFQIYVLGDTAFGTVDLINQVRGDSFNHHAIVGMPKSRTLQDGRKISEIKTRGQQVYLNDLDIPVYLSWVWLKRDGQRVQRFVISTKPMKGSTIARWGRRRWSIEAFFKTVKHRFSLHRFGQHKLLGVYRWLILSFISYLLAYWVYLHLGNNDNLDWFNSAQNALILLLPHVLLLSLLTQLETVIPWLNDRGFDFCLMRCKI